MRDGFAYLSPYMLTPGQPPPGMDYLPASPHRLPTTRSGRAFTPPAPESTDIARTLSITGLDMGAMQRVREYQPVVHRLRLSASP